MCSGTNFGLKATSNVTFVKYWPNAFPNVIFTAQSCAVTRDHEEISCLTDVGAGAGGLRPCIGFAVCAP